MNLGRDPAHFEANRSELSLGLRPIAGPLKQLSLAVEHGIESLDVAGQLRHDAAQLGTKEQGRGRDGLVITTKVSHLLPAQRERWRLLARNLPTSSLALDKTKVGLTLEEASELLRGSFDRLLRGGVQGAE